MEGFCKVLNCGALPLKLWHITLVFFYYWCQLGSITFCFTPLSYIYTNKNFLFESSFVVCWCDVWGGFSPEVDCYWISLIFNAYSVSYGFMLFGYLVHNIWYQRKMILGFGSFKLVNFHSQFFWKGFRVWNLEGSTRQYWWFFFTNFKFWFSIILNIHSFEVMVYD